MSEKGQQLATIKPAQLAVASPDQPQSAPRSFEWHRGVPTSVIVPTIVGLVVLLGGFVGFGVWATTAPIEGAVVAPGTFVATGQNKIIQHLEGGRIQEILVDEGDVVEPGQVLIRLEQTDPNANLRRYQLAHSRALAMQARLLAETEEAEDIIFPEDLLKEAERDDEMKMIIDRQNSEFEARRTNMDNRVAIHRKQIRSYEKVISGLTTQRTAVSKQLKLIALELESQQHLYKKGLAKIAKVYELQRTQAKLEGQVGEFTAKIGEKETAILGVNDKISQVLSQELEESEEMLRDVEAQMIDLEQQKRKAKNVVDHIEIKAPVRGAVVKLMYHTPGGVIKPGDEILELLPVNDELIIEARVRPQDIDVVQNGQTALIRMTALNQRITPIIGGTVVYVSADLVEEQDGDQTTQDSAYVARISLDEEEAAKVRDLHPTPGMPAEIYIKTGERSFLDYIVRPVLDSMSRAFRES